MEEVEVPNPLPCPHTSLMIIVMGRWSYVTADLTAVKLCQLLVLVVAAVASSVAVERAGGSQCGG